MTSATDIYRARFEAHLQIVAGSLEGIVRDHLTDVPKVERVVARAKDPSRFAEKATRTDDSGEPKYISPLTEVQDQIGVRVIVYYTSNVVPVADVLRNYFRPTEERELVPESHWQFGYFGRHLVLALPRDVVPHGVPSDEVPGFFELQIKTLFQHAWSEANHDLGYKSEGELAGDQQRRLAYTAAQAWGADRVFDELCAELLQVKGDDAVARRP